MRAHDFPSSARYLFSTRLTAYLPVPPFVGGRCVCLFVCLFECALPFGVLLNGGLFCSFALLGDAHDEIAMNNWKTSRSKALKNAFRTEASPWICPVYPPLMARSSLLTPPQRFISVCGVTHCRSTIILTARADSPPLIRYPPFLSRPLSRISP